MSLSLIVVRYSVADLAADEYHAPLPSLVKQDFIAPFMCSPIF